MKLKPYFLILLILISQKIFSQNYTPVVLNSAHVRTLKSDIIEDMEYVLNIALPSGYQETSMSYPVVYMLDAYEIFGLQLQIYQQLIFFETVPPVILVGINYKVKEQDFYKGLHEYLYIRFMPLYILILLTTGKRQVGTD